MFRIDSEFKRVNGIYGLHVSDQGRNARGQLDGTLTWKSPNNKVAAQDNVRNDGRSRGSKRFNGSIITLQRRRVSWDSKDQAGAGFYVK
ncbi:hypothetical protein Tco_0007378 [Tanacetum coccineum]